MKELTIGQKAKKYDEALEKAKKELQVCGSANCDASKQIFRFFPELKESKNENIKKTLIDYFNTYKKQEECGINTFFGIPTDNIIAWLEKSDEDKKEINNFDVLPGLYKCVHRMFDGTPNGRLLFEVGNVYKCLSKHDRAEFEVSHGHSVYLEDPVVCKHFIPFEKQGKQKKQVHFPKFTFEDVLALECSMKTAKITKGGDKLYEILVPLYNKIRNAYLAEKQDTFSKKDVDDAYLKGVEDAKNEIEKQYEANYKIRKDIATFIFNSREDIKDRAKWMNYLGIKVSFVEEQGEKKHKFNIGDVITNGKVVYRVENIVQNCIGQDCYFLVNIERENKGMRYFEMTDPQGKKYNLGERTCLCEQIDAGFEKQSEQELSDNKKNWTC